MILENLVFSSHLYYCFEELPSTNDYALAFIRQQQLPRYEGVRIRALTQTAGRGQRDNIWLSAPQQNITASFVVQPHFLLLKEQFYLSIIAALAVYTCVKNFLPLAQNICIKWPNDILCEKQKIAGLLIENICQTNKIDYAVLGIGLNVNQANFSDELSATSLYLQNGTMLEVETVFQKLTALLEKYYILLKNGQYDLLKQQYLEALYLYQQVATFRRSDNGLVFEGTIQGIDTYGRLLVRNTREQVETFAFKELVFL
ncbi:MAG: biotin--[acetyl-CoA-carboxylase] ligase [Chitinophagales bacterium]|nr:biotin--[acetyl-CoA-carboxylase] ligase [Bacteroidota bacterium]MCB9042264.1 biotin--[acetyl-CoA-carboxylase] ligase [Chitinophagales bacterium]